MGLDASYQPERYVYMVWRTSTEHVSAFLIGIRSTPESAEREAEEWQRHTGQATNIEKRQVFP